MKSITDSKITIFIKKMFSLPHRAFAFPYKSKAGSDGLLYANQFLRSISIMFDLLILMLILQLFSYSFGYFFMQNIPVEAVEKMKLGAQVFAQENALLVSYYKKIFLMQVLQLVFVLWFVVFSWHKFGATPAKLLLGLRVLQDESLAKPTVVQCLKRFFVFPISVLCIFLGVLWSVFDKKGRAWHDIAAGTVVVMKKSLRTESAH